MVQKKGKGHIHSGNPLRKCPQNLKSHYVNYSAIVKHVINTNASANADQTLQTNIVYSLNKKNRWKLVDDIKREVLTKQNDPEVDVHVSLTKYHNLDQTSNCRLHMTTMKETVCRPKPGATYFNAKTVVPHVDENGLKTIRKRVVNNNRVTYEYKTVQADPEVRYEVYTPSPSKVLMEKGWIVKSKNTHATKRRKHKEISWEDFDDVDYTDEDELDISDAQTYNTTDWENGNSDGSHCQVNNNYQKFLDRSSYYKSPKPFDTKAKVVLVSRDDFQKQKEVASEEQPTLPICSFLEETESMSRRVGIPVEALEPEFLRAVYDDRYTEAACVPRRFTIDMSDEVIQFARRMNWFPRPNLEAYVCFACSDEWVAEDGVEIVDVSFHSNLHTAPFCVETLCEFQMYTPLDVIDSVLKYLTTLPKSCFESKHLSIKTRSQNKFTNFDMVNSLYDGTVHSEILGDICRKSTKEDNFIVDAKYAVPVVKDELCSVCYSASITSATSTALTSCLHWFCNDCWKRYLVSKVRNGAVKLLCLEASCDSEVDYTTLLSFVPFRLVGVYFQQQVACQHLWKWCPNPRCGNVLVSQGSKVEAVNIKCGCGLNVCFKCLEASHWPATCDMAAKYKERLVSNGYDVMIRNSFGDSSVRLKIKYCPKCGNGIDKDGGCTQMICACRHSFCWKCLESHTGYVCEKSDVDLMEINFESPAFNKTGDPNFLRAIEGRRNQHPILVTKLRQKVMEVASKLKSCETEHITCHPSAAILKLSDLNGPEADTSSFPDLLSCERRVETQLERECKQTVQKNRIVNGFLLRTVDFSRQIHHVMEYLNILIEARRHTEKPTAFLSQSLNTLSFTASVMDQIIMAGKNQDMKQVIPRLQRLINTAGDSLRNLALCVKSIQH